MYVALREDLKADVTVEKIEDRRMIEPWTRRNIAGLETQVHHVYPQLQPQWAIAGGEEDEACRPDTVNHGYHFDTLYCNECQHCTDLCFAPAADYCWGRRSTPSVLALPM